MRPQQQNRRMRGRGGGGGNNMGGGRKGPNPLTRNYESNGPDVKIRGSAQQIAEKYATLARDAQSSGDRVMAENYLQHAEHYNRIIAAAQAQFASQQIQSPRDDLDDDLDDGPFGFEGVNGVSESQHQQPQPQPVQHQQPQPQHVNGSGPQPEIEGVPAEVALNSEASGQPQGGGRHRERRHRHPRNQVNGNGHPGPQSSPTPSEQPAEAVAAPPEADVQASPAVDEQREQPRRGRRPRRRSEEQLAGEQGADAAPETAGSETAPADA